MNHANHPPQTIDNRQGMQIVLIKYLRQLILPPVKRARQNTRLSQYADVGLRLRHHQPRQRNRSTQSATLAEKVNFRNSFRIAVKVLKRLHRLRNRSLIRHSNELRSHRAGSRILIKFEKLLNLLES